MDFFVCKGGFFLNKNKCIYLYKQKIQVKLHKAYMVKTSFVLKKRIRIL